MCSAQFNENRNKIILSKVRQMGYGAPLILTNTNICVYKCRWFDIMIEGKF